MLTMGQQITFTRNFYGPMRNLHSCFLLHHRTLQSQALVRIPHQPKVSLLVLQIKRCSQLHQGLGIYPNFESKSFKEDGKTKLGQFPQWYFISFEHFPPMTVKTPPTKTGKLSSLLEKFQKES